MNLVNRWGIFFLLLLPGISLPLTATSFDPLLSDLDARISSVQSLTSFGRPTSLYGLDTYVTLIESYLGQNEISPQQLAYALILAEKLFAPLVYRDGSERSRIFQVVHHSLLTLLHRTQTGRALLMLLAQKNPIVDEQSKLFTTL